VSLDTRPVRDDVALTLHYKNNTAFMPWDQSDAPSLPTRRAERWPEDRRPVGIPVSAPAVSPPKHPRDLCGEPEVVSEVVVTYLRPACATEQDPFRARALATLAPGGAEGAAAEAREALEQKSRADTLAGPRCQQPVPVKALTALGRCSDPAPATSGRSR